MLKELRNFDSFYNKEQFLILHFATHIFLAKSMRITEKGESRRDSPPVT